MNLIQSIFTFCALSSGLTGILIILLKPYLPKFVTSIYRFGKFAEKSEHPFVANFELPKRFFAHFYIFAAPFSMSILILTLYKYLYNGGIPLIVYDVLDYVLGDKRKALVSAESTTLAMFLITVQCYKRLYETHFVSIFSNAKMNICHYIVGFIHYFGVVISIIGDSRGFVRGTHANFVLSKISFIQWLCAFIFLWASYKQLRTNVILANLRKDEKGFVVTKSYKIPSGELFEYISSPLQFTEIIMYICLSIILYSASTFHYVTFWVIANQTGCALLAQEWYHETFKNYPKSRKILIPCLF